MKKTVDKREGVWYNITVAEMRHEKNGGVAQLARATGSYPVGHGFKSNLRYHFSRPIGRDMARWSSG